VSGACSTPSGPETELSIKSSNRTVDKILPSAYEKDLSGVRDLAGATVRAHLEKLAHEGRVEWDGAHADPLS